MPVAIRMANGSTYYSEGGFNYENAFEHAYAGNQSKKTKVTNSTKKMPSHTGGYSATGSGSVDEATRYAEQRQREGYVMNTSGLRPDWVWVTKDTLDKLNAAAAIINGAKNVGGAIAGGVKTAGGAVVKGAKFTGRTIKKEGENIATSAKSERDKYIESHTVPKTSPSGIPERPEYTGSKLGEIAALAKGGVKGTKAYQIGSAAVSKAAGMLGDFKKKVSSSKVGETYRNIKSAVGTTYSNAKQGISNAYGNAKQFLEDIGAKLKNSAVGQAAYNAGKHALDAGGNVVSAVGNAIDGIKKWFESRKLSKAKQAT